MPYNLSEFVRDFKKHIARTIVKKIGDEPESRRSWTLSALREAGKYDKRITNYKFWQEGCHPIQLNNNEMIDQRINYVHENPVRKMIVEKAEDYLFKQSPTNPAHKPFWIITAVFIPVIELIIYFIISKKDKWLFRSDHASLFGQIVPLKKIIQ
ncbi:hypothetical protein [Roseimarinus sediminis]|uniref:hypothetical protein n=1 Tax=Roseimarinus sediminis TaxID=1610899 RepID=UPI003D20BF26